MREDLVFLGWVGVRKRDGDQGIRKYLRLPVGPFRLTSTAGVY